MGDFNARTQNKQDFLDEDGFFSQLFDYDHDLTDHFQNSSILDKCNMPKIRVSQDKTINNEGNMLIDICKANSLFILNGRCGSDKHIGAMTFRGQSIIDYTIISHQALGFVKMFSILELDSIFSDGHSLITTTLSLEQKLASTRDTVNHGRKSRPKLPVSKQTLFVQSLDHSKISELKEVIVKASKNLNVVNFDKINDICNKFSEIYSTAAQSCNNNDDQGPKQKKGKKVWFGRQCERARKHYHTSKSKHSKHPSITTKLNLQQASKTYKKKMNYFINKHNKSTQNKLRSLKNKSPKEYWKIINSIDNKKADSNIELDKLYTFFKDLNEQPDTEHDFCDNNIEFSIDDNDEILNSPITDSEILKCIKLLKNNKACANDDIINEYIKSTAHIMLPLYTSFFNLILETGTLPEAWLEGIIKPIYKKKGDPQQPENYRPITILSCFGKLFTSVLNLRLSSFLNEHDILAENQAGFRAGYSTCDHIFALHALIEILKSKKLKMFCSFIDFSKAFDSVWRVGLWSKLLKNNINGKFFRIILNMYNGIKSCVSFNGDQSDFFPCLRGVRQGENLSPVLFALFLNDLESFMHSNNCAGIDLEHVTDNLYMYLRIFILLYADDTVIFGVDAADFQKNLDVFYEYARMWHLDINFDKTKILIFGTRNDDRFHFKMGENEIQICKEFKYLGVVFAKSRSFCKAKKHNYDQAKKAMHLLYKRIRNLNLPIDLQLQLFEHTILPIALYGCEIWAFENTKIIEKLQNEFLRYITNSRKSTPAYMLHAELGCKPIDIKIKTRMIGFWLNIVNGKDAKISKFLYKFLLSDYDSGNNQHKWIQCIKDILISVGRVDLLHKDSIENPKSIKMQISKTLSDLYIQEWHSKIASSSKGLNYNLFKVDANFENYLSILSRKHYSTLLKFRLSNHRLPIETGRWENIPIEERKCNICEINDIGDEFHYLFVCKYFKSARQRFLTPYFYKSPNVIKYRELMSTENVNLLIKISNFVEIIMKKFSITEI